MVHLSPISVSRKVQAPAPQAVFGLLEIPSRERPSSDVDDLPRPTPSLDSRATSRSDLSIHDRPPLVASTVTETSIAPSNGPVYMPQTPTKGAALLSRIGSVKKWGVRRKRGDSTPSDAKGTYERTTHFSFTYTLFSLRVLSWVSFLSVYSSLLFPIHLSCL